MNTDTRIVITGTGAISPVGIGVRETFDNLVKGVSGVDRVTQFDPSRLASKIAGEVKGFDPLDYVDRKMSRRIGRYAQFALAATAEALAQSGLDLEAENRDRIASVASSAIGDFPILEHEMLRFFNHGIGRTNPFTVPRVSTSMAAGNISLVHGLTGPAYGSSSACSTGSHSLATAWMMLSLGLADVAVAGGAESAITATFMESYIALRALSTQYNDDPQRASRPFDKDRDGFVMAEGAGILILETLEHAQARGATILAELAGVGMSCDAFHITSAHPDGLGASMAIDTALKTAGIAPGEVDYINAHGTSTQVNDPIETNAIRNSFGEYAQSIPISSTKSMMGHAIGASGALEAITSVMVINEGVIPPTINLDTPDERCDLDYVPHVARHQPVNVVVSNSFAFGGQNCVLVFRGWQDGVTP